MFGQQIPKWKDCPICGSKLSCEFMFCAHASCCPKCKEKKEKEAKAQGEVNDQTGTFTFKRHKEITAVMKDKRTGQMVGVDTKGRKVDMKDTIYDLRNDRFGWRAAGRKVRKTDKYGRINN